MRVQKPLSLPYRLELSHPSFSNPGRLMGLLCSIILVLLSAVNRVGNQLTMRDSITTQFVGNDLPGLAAMASQ